VAQQSRAGIIAMAVMNSFTPKAAAKHELFCNSTNHQWNMHFKNVNNCLNTHIYSYLGTSAGQSSNLYLNVVHFSIQC
jgi:hypothetical protein